MSTNVSLHQMAGKSSISKKVSKTLFHVGDLCVAEPEINIYIFCLQIELLGKGEMISESTQGGLE